MNRFFLILIAPIVVLFPNMAYSQKQSHFMKEQQKNRLLIQTIGINYKSETGLRDISTVSDLLNYEKNNIAKDHIFPGYPDSGKVLRPLYGIELTIDSILNCLQNLVNEAKGTDVVILHIVGHGKCDNEGNYYLLCSDGKGLERNDILNHIKKMASNGAIVVIFLDTCNSGALFEANENDDFLEDKGGIAFFASSQRDQLSRETKSSTKFTKTILKSFEKRGQLTVGELSKKIYEAFENVDSTQQKPDTLFLPQRRTIEGYRIQDYPIIRPLADTPEPNNKKFYFGIAVGSNHTCTPFADVNLGVDINNSHKIEAGITYSPIKSNEVYIYDNNGILQNALQYKAMSFYARYGFNWLSLCKDKRRSEFITLAGLSGNIVKGYNLSGFNSNIGKTAGSLMGDICCRWALEVYKDNKRNVLLHMTAGFDFPIKRDGNVCNVLNNEKYIKNWRSFRPYIEAGVIISPKFLNF